MRFLAAVIVGTVATAPLPLTPAHAAGAEPAVNTHGVWSPPDLAAAASFSCFLLAVG